MPPAIGHSRGRWFLTKSGALVAPLSLVMGIGERAAELHYQAAREHRWGSLESFLRWAEQNKKVLNRGALQSLAKAGAFAPFGVSPEHAHDLMGCWAGLKASKKNGTVSEQLVSYLAFGKDANGNAIFTTQEDGETRMHFERAALGFSYWHNPWSVNDRERTVMKLIDDRRIADESEKRLRGKRRAYVVSGIRKHTDKSGKVMAFLTLQSITGASTQGIVFGSLWKDVRKKVRVDGVYLVSGEFDPKGTYIVGGSSKPFIDVDGVRA